MAEVTRDAPFGRVLTAMITPFLPNGDLDVDGAAVLARHLVADGNDGLVIAGSTGESTLLSDEERIRLWETVVRAVEVPVLAGSTTGDTRHSVELTKAAESAGVAGILATTPYYSRPSQAGLLAHFEAVVSATTLPVVLYDIPSRTGRKLGEETILELAGHERVVGLKDAGGDPVATSRLLSRTPAAFACYSGDDALTLPLLSIGACGVISVAAHWCAPELGELIAAYLEGDVGRATALHRAGLASFAFESSELAPNPVPTKAMLRHLGLPAGQCRLPLGDAPRATEAAAAEVWAGLQAFRSGRG